MNWILIKQTQQSRNNEKEFEYGITDSTILVNIFYRLNEFFNDKHINCKKKLEKLFILLQFISILQQTHSTSVEYIRHHLKIIKDTGAHFQNYVKHKTLKECHEFVVIKQKMLNNVVEFQKII